MIYGADCRNIDHAVSITVSTGAQAPDRENPISYFLLTNRRFHFI